MKTSESVKEIAGALAKAQGMMAGARKDSNNPAFNSKYADLASVVDAIKKPLADNGIAYVQTPCTNEKDEVGVETLLVHSSGEWIAGDPFFMPVAKASAHGFGSILTYARRYSLAAICGIAPEDDDGNAGVKAGTNGKEQHVEPGPPRKLRGDVFQQFCTQMQAATKTEALQRAYTAAVIAARAAGDPEAERSFGKKKDECKEFILAAQQNELASQG